MNGNKALLDSNVIIDASKNLISVVDIINSYDMLFTSIICYIEVLGFNFKTETEKNAVERIFKSLSVININREIADFTVELRKKSKIKLPDALIMASAEIIEADLITSNISDFKNHSKNISVITPKSR